MPVRETRARGPARLRTGGVSVGSVFVYAPRVILVFERPGSAGGARVGDELAKRHHQVVRSTDVDDAVTRASAGDVDLVVVVRPADTVADACALLRAAAPRAALLAVTDGLAGASRVAALDAGADDVVDDHVEADDLAARVRALLRRDGRDARLRCGAVEIARYERRAKVGGVDVDLTEREYSVLRCLVEHGGKPVPRATLAAAVTRSGDRLRSNAIDVHVSNIRKKLGTRAAMIETARGIGYRLRD